MSAADNTRYVDLMLGQYRMRLLRQGATILREKALADSLAEALREAHECYGECPYCPILARYDEARNDGVEA